MSEIISGSEERRQYVKPRWVKYSSREIETFREALCKKGYRATDVSPYALEYTTLQGKQDPLAVAHLAMANGTLKELLASAD